MTAPTYLDYCYGEEMEIDSFCRLPRIFVTNEFYCTVPAEIKILYGLMLDRVAMSMRNNWREDGRVFIYFTVDSAARLLNVSRYKAIRLFERMETLGLIRRCKQEAKQPARIFVRTFVEPPNAGGADFMDFMEAENESAETSVQSAQIDRTPEEDGTPEEDATPAQSETRDVPDTAPVHREISADSETSDSVREGLSDLLGECAISVRRLGDLLIGSAVSEGQTSQNQTSRLPLCGSLDFPNLHPNYTDKRYNEFFDYNQSIYREAAALYEACMCEETAATEKEKNLNILRRLIQNNIDYEGLLRDYPERRDEITGYVEMMAQACCSDRREIRLNLQDFPQACVCSRFEKLERRHMEYVLKCMKQLPLKIHNIRAYALSTLYNSYEILRSPPQSEKSLRKARKRYKNWHDPNE